MIQLRNVTSRIAKSPRRCRENNVIKLMIYQNIYLLK